MILTESVDPCKIPGGVAAARALPLRQPRPTKANWPRSRRWAQKWPVGWYLGGVLLGRDFPEGPARWFLGTSNYSLIGHLNWWWWKVREGNHRYFCLKRSCLGIIQILPRYTNIYIYTYVTTMVSPYRQQGSYTSHFHIVYDHIKGDLKKNTSINFQELDVYLL